MRLSVTVLGLDLLTIELSTDSAATDSSPGDCVAAPVVTGFSVPWREGGVPDFVD